MNTKISQTLLHCLSASNPKDELDYEVRNIVDAHNNAFNRGFVDLQELIFFGVDYSDNFVLVTVKPRLDFMYIHELYNLKELWGADDLRIIPDGIQLIFKK